MSNRFRCKCICTCDFGNTNFDFQEDLFKIVFKHHFRIKILKKEGFDWGTFAIYLFHHNGVEEKLVNLKGCTYNLENGKIVTTSLDKHTIFKEDFNKNFRTIKYAMPNIKEGSIIEITYEINSDFFSIHPWNFQYDIPNIYSEYLVDIPEFYSFKKFINGYESIQLSNSVERRNLPISIKERSDNGWFVSSNVDHASIDYQDYSTKYYANNIKAFKIEPYMLSKVNYISSIEFELESIHYPNSLVKLYSHDWKSIHNEYMNSESFGEIIKSPGRTSDLVKNVTMNINDSLQKANALFNYIRDNFKWNGFNSDLTSKSLKNILEDKSGNSADINLLLVAALRKAGLKADPVVLSTRDNGLILNEYPLINKINYVIVNLNIKGKQFLLDATDKYLPFGLLPEKCINGDGELLNEDVFQKVELKSTSNYNNYQSTTYTIDSIGNINGSLDEVDKGYASVSFRGDIENAKDQYDYIQNIQKSIPGLSISKFSFVNIDSVQKDLIKHYDYSLTGYVEFAGNLLMIHPLLFEQKKENEFKIEDRKFPVDFSYNVTKTYMSTFIVPTDYQIETLPKQISISMPDKVISFSYLISQHDNRIQVLRKFIIQKTTFLPSEYKDLKEFYNQIVLKESEPIVLKKITHNL